MDYDFEMNESEDENDRRMLWKKRHYRVLYCYHHKHGGTYYRKLQINKNEIDESKDITPDQVRSALGYEDLMFMRSYMNIQCTHSIFHRNIDRNAD